MEEIEKSEAIELVKKVKEASAIEVAFLKDKLDRDSAKGFLELREHGDLIEMRKKWSSGVFWLLVLIIFSDVGFSWALGFGALSFDSDWSVPAFIGDGLIKTLGLAFIVVHFLFNKDSLKNKL